MKHGENPSLAQTRNQRGLLVHIRGEHVEDVVICGAMLRHDRPPDQAFLDKRSEPSSVTMKDLAAPD